MHFSVGVQHHLLLCQEPGLQQVFLQSLCVPIKFFLQHKELCLQHSSRLTSNTIYAQGNAMHVHHCMTATEKELTPVLHVSMICPLIAWTQFLKSTP